MKIIACEISIHTSLTKLELAEYILYSFLFSLAWRFCAYNRWCPHLYQPHRAFERAGMFHKFHKTNLSAFIYSGVKKAKYTPLKSVLW